MERKRKWISLNVKVNVVIIAIVLVQACGLAGIAYYVNGQRTDRYYKDSTAKMAAAVAHFVDGDFVARLQAAVESEEYVQLRQQAEAAKDEQQIVTFLKEQGLYEDFEKTNEMLRVYRDKLGAESVYLQSVSGNRGVNLVDPSEDMLYVGSVEISAEEFSAHSSNERIEPTVSTTQFGWLCSAYEPVLDSRGQAVTLVESLLPVVGCEQLEFPFKDAGQEPQHVSVVLDQEHCAEFLISVLRLYLVTSRRYHSFLVISILQG